MIKERDLEGLDIDKRDETQKALEYEFLMWRCRIV